MEILIVLLIEILVGSLSLIVWVVLLFVLNIIIFLFGWMFELVVMICKCVLLFLLNSFYNFLLLLNIKKLLIDVWFLMEWVLIFCIEVVLLYVVIIVW